MPAILRPAVSIPTARHLRRGSSVSARRWRIILTAALIATALATFLKLSPLPVSIVSVLNPSFPSAFTNSTLESVSSSMASRIPALNRFITEERQNDQKLSALIRPEMITMESKGTNAGDNLPNSINSKAEVSEMFSSEGVLPTSTMLEKPRKQVKPYSSSRKVPFWALPPHEAMLYAKQEIEHAPIVIDDLEIYAPVFLNLSVFKRSYELMDRILQVYIYPDGSRPIFHTPELQGIYASEGWFMKLMEESQRFVAKDPKSSPFLPSIQFSSTARCSLFSRIS
ncbi:hypothetical protein HPP92_009499 [Vanilla planifolia]|uniref:Uncharacterized protein n=1 Tax=Vanilla planifolia TaxID=51239 RepID=A0A835V4S0_VANPL|nr:hypothetical protein HPP92_009499 [Vanilla planifolia]